MPKFLRTIAAVAGFAAACLAVNEATALPRSDAAGMRVGLDSIDVTSRVQYTYAGRSYCWYDDGWNGPGWYVCGQYRVRGVGWGGAAGWRGWTRGGGRVGGGRTGGGRAGHGGGGGGRAGHGRGGGGRAGHGGGGGGRGGGRRSDIALKHDIVLLGHLDNGLGFYRFSYNGSDTAYVGVMAQEVQAVMPLAVTRGNDGYLRVFYDKIGVTFQTYDRWLALGAHVPAGLPIRH